MEKIMIKRHREQRSSVKENKKFYHKTEKINMDKANIDKNDVSLSQFYDHLLRRDKDVCTLQLEETNSKS